MAAGGAGATATGEASGGAPSDDADAATVGLWEATGQGQDAVVATDLVPDVEAEAESEFDASTDLPAGDVELDLARAALGSDDLEEAVVRLGLVLRVAPALAPAVLDLIEGRTERGLALVRGDAYRLVGRELDARRAFVEAARGGASLFPSAVDDPPDHPLQGDPA